MLLGTMSMHVGTCILQQPSLKHRQISRDFLEGPGVQASIVCGKGHPVGAGHMTGLG